MKDETEVMRHESFGQIRFARVNGRSTFYGSELEQDHFIEMTVRQSEVRRELTRDWYFDYGKTLVQIKMTAGQFSELITSLNNGCGIPCTVQVLDGKPLQPMPVQESRKEVIHRQFKDRMKMFADEIRSKKDTAKEIVKKKTLSKADIQNLSFLLDWLTTEIEGNIPFFAECFQETMDTMVFEAKTEVENHIQHKINTLGIEALLNGPKPIGIEEGI